MDHEYLRLWDISMMVDYCWCIKHDIATSSAIQKYWLIIFVSDKPKWMGKFLLTIGRQKKTVTIFLINDILV